MNLFLIVADSRNCFIHYNPEFRSLFSKDSNFSTNKARILKFVHNINQWLSCKSVKFQRNCNIFEKVISDLESSVFFGTPCTCLMSVERANKRRSESTHVEISAFENYSLLLSLSRLKKSCNLRFLLSRAAI